MKHKPMAMKRAIDTFSDPRIIAIAARANKERPVFDDLMRRFKEQAPTEQFNGGPSGSVHQDKWPWPDSANVLNCCLNIEGDELKNIEGIIAPVINNIAGSLVHKGKELKDVIEFSHGPIITADKRNIYAFNLRYV